MRAFVTLSKFVGADRNRTTTQDVVIRSSRIRAMEFRTLDLLNGLQPKVTRVELGRDEEIFVTETPDEIVKMMERP